MEPHCSFQQRGELLAVSPSLDPDTQKLEAVDPEAGEPGSCCLTRPSPSTTCWLEMSLTEVTLEPPGPVQHLEQDKIGKTS